MVKYLNSKVTFSEVPDEISLCINITGCKYRCKGCHSPWLWEDTGEELTKEVLNKLIFENPGITCVCFMGGEPEDINELAKDCPVKVAYYTGAESISDKLELENFSYIKVGPYIKEFGGLSSRYTNQTFYYIDENLVIHDITDKFWK